MALERGMESQKSLLGTSKNSDLREFVRV